MTRSAHISRARRTGRIHGDHVAVASASPISMVVVIVGMWGCSRPPRRAQEYHRRGYARYVEGDYDRAVEAYSAAIMLRPERAEVYGDRGRAYSDKGEYDLAIADFTKAIELKLECAEIYCDRGMAYGCKGDHDRAIAA